MKLNRSHKWFSLLVMFAIIGIPVAFVLFQGELSSTSATKVAIAVAPVPVEEPPWPSSIDASDSGWVRSAGVCPVREGKVIDVAVYSRRFEMLIYSIQVFKLNGETIAYSINHYVHDVLVQRVTIVRNSLEGNWLRYDESHAPDPEPSYFRFLEEAGITDAEMSACKPKR